MKCVGEHGHERRAERPARNEREGQVWHAEGGDIQVEVAGRPVTRGDDDVPQETEQAACNGPSQQHQARARDPGAGGILKNTGILFETDGLTNFPKLDDTAHNTYGGALGLQYLFNLDQQVVVEVAGLGVRENDNEPGRAARGPQYGAGIRYQIPLTDSLIFRVDAIAARRDRDDDLLGVRSELRIKF